MTAANGFQFFVSNLKSRLKAAYKSYLPEESDRVQYRGLSANIMIEVD